MRFSVDPWDPSYGASLDAEELPESTARIGTDVELPAGRWRPLDPDPVVAPPAVTLFVDGVRRIDAQVWVTETGSGPAAPALCASYAAGVVRCGADGAHLVAADVRRGLFTTADHAVDVATSAGAYRASRAQARRDIAPAQVLSLALQARLGEAEIAVAVAARSGLVTGNDLLVVDGPLRGRQHLPRTLGYIKSHRSEYLRPPLNRLVTALGAGQRTPVFLLGSSWDRYTWYLRLPGEAGGPWAGVVRCECSATLSGPDAVAMARLSQATLGRYASAGYKDARAPQNLYPIGGLERALRRRLGDAGVLYRALRQAAGC